MEELVFQAETAEGGDECGVVGCEVGEEGGGGVEGGFASW